MNKLLKDMSKEEKENLLKHSDIEILGYVRGCPDDTDTKVCSSASDCVQCIKDYIRNER